MPSIAQKYDAVSGGALYSQKILYWVFKGWRD